MVASLTSGQRAAVRGLSLPEQALLRTALLAPDEGGTIIDEHLGAARALERRGYVKFEHRAGGLHSVKLTTTGRTIALLLRVGEEA